MSTCPQVFVVLFSILSPLICCYCCCSATKACLTLCDPWTVVCRASLSVTVSRSLLRFMSIESVMLSNHIILCHPLLLCLRSFPASGSFPVSWLFTSGGQSIEASASPSVLPMNIQGWFPLGLTGLISLQSSGISRVFFNLKASILQHLAFCMVQLISIHDCWKNYNFDYLDLCQQSEVSTF